ncbi:hypothetical protein EN836_23010 [Mesorhizobium sp. M1C.F.Ca.ET.193.01.1.1]|uniref:hypothetical protein n=1 Tax=unclassified Mesorhizobium TaxID=325217 RepID=UPI000FD23946|nr:MULTISPECIES: hypothetical protein [unclassified Mesorhizobium]TGS95550.1 hypothetical protein EN820_43730 [bacterium M00.F.Ca.ET.177.01.1.1]TGQ51627.1 hypothetical protein EN853_23000 [Mesorhizobium sp. M1C.F.Ca.ET.210.01.1.1]TGQ67857.1 hypothetical protein EN855_023010 [Mesorhizobium sp. M1C.F.Ca.ET.212.01.1.1]TGR02446.1 hypothetical protein EN847_23000 [Mesorhizobium sp. M1C.F.Ca.ET.204.01.1.1]TGR23489.1 hypothetical protein EN839_23000 [Mesorhizobium sp. M1C.F.Ca.ET.196.01.1.1]
MALQLWINDTGHFFVDTRLGGIQVGQAWVADTGKWTVEVNDDFFSARDLDDAKRLFVDLYDPARAVMSPFAVSHGNDDLAASFSIIDL